MSKWKKLHFCYGIAGAEQFIKLDKGLGCLWRWDKRRDIYGIGFMFFKRVLYVGMYDKEREEMLERLLRTTEEDK